MSCEGARTWERHIDIDDGKMAVSPYCSLHQIDEWFYAKATEMNGSYLNERRPVCQQETDYLNNLVRGHLRTMRSAERHCCR